MWRMSGLFDVPTVRCERYFAFLLLENSTIKSNRTLFAWCHVIIIEVKT